MYFSVRFYPFTLSKLPSFEFVVTGELRAVADTPFDFRKPVRLGDRLKEGPHGRGFFHNFCLGESGPLKQAAV